ncbi:transposase [Corallococcus sp. RDP092CA]|uniref:transposase n=1 Tax=Corallococcus sp. RDP092CA TaxID=3109369 RepID=UPI0035B3F365
MPDLAIPERTPYPSDLTDEQWALIEPFVSAVGGGPKEQVHPRREVVNAILYVTRTGVQWRFLPHDLPDWQSVYHSFRNRPASDVAGGIAGVAVVVDPGRNVEAG